MNHEWLHLQTPTNQFILIDDTEVGYDNAGTTSSPTYGISSSNPDSIGGNGAG